MPELQMRQGTVYQEQASGVRRMFIHHNPMQLQSLQLSAVSADAPFDLAHPEVIEIDTLIAMRKSEKWLELGDLPPETVDTVLRVLSTSPVLAPEVISCIQAVLRERGVQ